ncbi:MAG: hypothetical protein H6R19_3253 [Proteobacteria bacterium]|nr:hypothetical protein [Pseudomonadota bacterium]
MSASADVERFGLWLCSRDAGLRCQHLANTIEQSVSDFFRIDLELTLRDRGFDFLDFATIHDGCVGNGLFQLLQVTGQRRELDC